MSLNRDFTVLSKYNIMDNDLTLNYFNIVGGSDRIRTWNFPVAKSACIPAPHFGYCAPINNSLWY